MFDHHKNENLTQLDILVGIQQFHARFPSLSSDLPVSKNMPTFTFGVEQSDLVRALRSLADLVDAVKDNSKELPHAV